jgi:hypothetical protein
MNDFLAEDAVSTILQWYHIVENEKHRTFYRRCFAVSCRSGDPDDSVRVSATLEHCDAVSWWSARARWRWDIWGVSPAFRFNLADAILAVQEASGFASYRMEVAARKAAKGG